ncbi:MAG: acyltransferase [Burkholderiales bacterium]|nr:acyltransferase [Burkholderiales bacterium]
MHYKSIQTGRAIAALMVVFFHLGGTIALEKYFGISWFGHAFSFGHAGVHFFFVLSGFIIMQVHMDDLFKPERIRSFLTKRCIRIYPIYWLIFLGVFLFALAIPSLRNNVPSDIGLILKALTLMPLDKAVVGGTGAPVLIVAWSLQYELYFYVLFGLAILNRWVAIALLVLLPTGMLLGFGVGNFPVNFFWSDWLVLFFFGMGVAVLVRRNQMKFLNPIAVIGVSIAILVATASLEALGDAGEITWLKIFWGIGFAGLIFGYVRCEQAGRRLPLLMRHKSVQTLGDASYFLYLIHFPLISLLCKVAVAAGLTGIAGASITFILIAFACVLVSFAGHLLIERPMQKWFSQTFIPRRVLAPAASQ